MAQGVVKQNSFITGLISPQAWERSDMDEFYHGMFIADNVEIRSQGGVSRRQGLRFIDKVPFVPIAISNGFTIGAPNGGDFNKLTNGDIWDFFKTTTPIGNIDAYVGFDLQFDMVTYVDYIDLSMISVDNGISRAQIGSDEWQMQYSVDGGITWKNAKSIYISNINDDSYRAFIGDNISNFRLIRVGTTDFPNYFLWVGELSLWTMQGSESQGVVRLQSIVKSFSQNYLLMFVNGGIDVYRDDKLIYQLPTPQIQPSQIPNLKFSSMGDSLIMTHPDIDPTVIQVFQEDTIFRIYPMIFNHIPRYDASLSHEALAGSCSVVTETGVSTLSSGSNNFFPEDVGCMVYGNGGSCRIVAYTSATSCQVVIVNPFPSGWGQSSSTGWTIERRSEPLWGDEQGFPECSCFFANRLWFGGFKKHKNVIACSVIGNYFDFDVGDSSDDDALVIALQSGSLGHHVRHMFGQNNLEIFTDTGVFALKKFDAGSLVNIAASFYFRKPIGIDALIPPFTFEDGGTMFVKYGRADIREIFYNDDSYGYDSKSRVLWCQSYVEGISSVAVVRSTEADLANKMFLVNGAGNICCMTFMLSDEIHGATRWTTDGKFITLGSSINNAYAIVDRGGDKYLEKISDDAYTDSEEFYEDVQGGKLNVPQRFIGKNVHVRGDDEYLGEFFVDNTATIGLPNGHWHGLHVGLPFESVVVPVSPEVRDGTIATRLKNCYQAVVSVYQTRDLIVDGYKPEFLGRTFNLPNLTDRVMRDGRYRVFLGGDPSLTPMLTIRQPLPLEFNLRSVIYSLEAN
jgi:hypothetical protein